MRATEAAGSRNHCRARASVRLRCNQSRPSWVNSSGHRSAKAGPAIAVQAKAHTSPGIARRRPTKRTDTLCWPSRRINEDIVSPVNPLQYSRDGHGMTSARRAIELFFVTV